MNYRTRYTANQDIRQYMEDHGVTQRSLAARMGVSQYAINKTLNTELSQKEKEDLIRHIDAIAQKTVTEERDECSAEVQKAEKVEDTEEPAQADVTVSTKYRIGDRVKIPSKSLCIGIVSDVWHSLLQNKLMYAVQTEGAAWVCTGRTSWNRRPCPSPTALRLTSTAMWLW